MSYHSPDTSRNLRAGNARMPSMSTASMGNMTIDAPKTQPLKADKAGIYMDELGIATAAEKNKRGYLSTYLEGQTAPNKISNWLKGSL